MIGKIAKELERFRDERDWRKYHTPANLAAAIAVEAGELQELYLWGNNPNFFDVQDEVADVAIFLLNLVNVLDIDLEKAIMDKIEKNRKKYPVEKFKGRAKLDI